MDHIGIDVHRVTRAAAGGGGGGEHDTTSATESRLPDRSARLPLTRRPGAILATGTGRPSAVWASGCLGCRMRLIGSR